ncbi:type 4b pilus protein PilO2 [Pectobacterium cacticida]|uniref:Type 4b pilus protein PilO2 n=1 Tax=Pectobacterium cacticida TaxID=69221 RepID=A0ABZ2G8I0_9GAMM|nr:type 4b pilus protein PilO2 [Pectobacterium cacticida]UYX07927.1 type 4b pilus protein PilO2 [Pectobacterium cacticida]
MIIVPHENGGLIAGLRWEPMAENRPRRFGRDVLSLKLTPVRGRNKGNQTSDRSQTADIHTGAPAVTGTCPWRTGRLWSLAALATNWTGENGYGVVQLGDDEYVFLATISGIPALNGDICGTRDDMLAITNEFIALTPTPSTGWNVASTPEAPAVPADILPRRRRDWPARYRLTCPARIQRALLVSVPVLFAVGIAGMWGVQYWQHWSARQAQAAKAKLVAMAAGDSEPSQKEKRVLPHPWVVQPSAQTLLTVCERKLGGLPLKLGFWPLSSADCRADGVMTTWVREKDNRLATVDRLIQATKSLSGSPVVLIDESGDSAQIAWSYPALPGGGDDRVIESESLRRQLLSFFQSRGIPPSLQSVPPTSIPADEKVIWIQDWSAFAFSHTSRLAPSFQLAGLSAAGLRLTRVGLTLEGRSLTWSWDGTAYSRAQNSVAPEGNAP